MVKGTEINLKMSPVLEYFFRHEMSKGSVTASLLLYNDYSNDIPEN